MKAVNTILGGGNGIDFLISRVEHGVKIVHAFESKTTQLNQDSANGIAPKLDQWEAQLAKEPGMGNARITAYFAVPYIPGKSRTRADFFKKEGSRIPVKDQAKVLVGEEYWRKLGITWNEVAEGIGDACSFAEPFGDRLAQPAVFEPKTSGSDIDAKLDVLEKLAQIMPEAAFAEKVKERGDAKHIRSPWTCTQCGSAAFTGTIAQLLGAKSILKHACEGCFPAIP